MSRIRPRRAAGHAPELSALRVRVVYADLDGTLLGPRGSLFAGPDGATGEGAAAVARLLAAGVDLVVVSGRTRDQVSPPAHILGATAYIAELGGILVERGEDVQEEVVTNYGAFRGPGTPHQALTRSGVGGLLLEAYPRRLEPHTPWSDWPREVSMMFRGQVDLAGARRLLSGAGFDWLDLADNGTIPAPPDRFPGLGVEEVHAYHLVPAGVSKASAVALDRERRGLTRDRCVAIGDSPSDAAMAAEVGAFFLVSNGTLDGAAADNVYALERPNGLGFAEAVRLLALN